MSKAIDAARRAKQLRKKEARNQRKLERERKFQEREDLLQLVVDTLTSVPVGKRSGERQAAKNMMFGSFPEMKTTSRVGTQLESLDQLVFADYSGFEVRVRAYALDFYDREKEEAQAQSQRAYATKDAHKTLQLAQAASAAHRR